MSRKTLKFNDDELNKKNFMLVINQIKSYKKYAYKLYYLKNLNIVIKVLNISLVTKAMILFDLYAFYCLR